MRNIFLFILVPVITILSSTSCRMAPKENLGDTVAARYFEPFDTTSTDSLHKKQPLIHLKDSTDIYYIGQGSTATQVQLVSYPSQRDTVLYAKGKHIKVAGNANFGHVVRAKLWVSEAGDTLVTRLEEVKTSFKK